MEIRNRSELANILGMEFKRYANNLENHYQLEPYLPYISGEKAVTVTVKLFNGGISIEKGPDTDVYKAEIGVLEGKIKDQAKEIKSLNILLEEQTFIEEHSPKLEEESTNTKWQSDKSQIVTIEETLEKLDKEKKEKKKRRTKKK